MPATAEQTTTGGESTNNMSEMDFNYVDLHEIDPTFKPVDAGVYTLQINKLTPKTVEIKNGKRAGTTSMILNGSYTIVNDPNFSGRKLWFTFWPNNLRDLRKQMDATGVEQQPGETMSDYAARFEELNPPAEFKCYVSVKPDYRDPDTMVNAIEFRQATAV